MKGTQVLKLAGDNDTTPAAILLSYQVARGSLVLAKSVNPSRIAENTKLVTLSDRDLAKLADIRRSGVMRFVYPEFGVDFGLPDIS